MQTSASAEDHALTSDEVSVAVREILSSRRNAEDPSPEVLQRVSVCGGRVAVHLALQIAGSDELAEVDTAISDRLRALGATDVQVVIRRPEPSPAGVRGRGDPWARQVRLAPTVVPHQGQNQDQQCQQDHSYLVEAHRH